MGSCILSCFASFDENVYQREKRNNARYLDWPCRNWDQGNWIDYDGLIHTRRWPIFWGSPFYENTSSGFYFNGETDGTHSKLGVNTTCLRPVFPLKSQFIVDFPGTWWPACSLGPLGPEAIGVPQVRLEDFGVSQEAGQWAVKTVKGWSQGKWHMASYGIIHLKAGQVGIIWQVGTPMASYGIIWHPVVEGVFRQGFGYT